MSPEDDSTLLKLEMDEEEENFPISQSHNQSETYLTPKKNGSINSDHPNKHDIYPTLEVEIESNEPTYSTLDKYETFSTLVKNDSPYQTNQISHINNEDSIIMKITIPPGAKAIMFFIVLIFTSNFELHLCIFNGSCTFLFWAWIRYVKSESSGQFRLLRRLKRVVWEEGVCRRREEREEKTKREEEEDVEKLLGRVSMTSHYEDKSFLPPR